MLVIRGIDGLREHVEELEAFAQKALTEGIIEVAGWTKNSTHHGLRVRKNDLVSMVERERGRLRGLIDVLRAIDGTASVEAYDASIIHRGFCERCGKVTPHTPLEGCHECQKVRESQ